MPTIGQQRHGAVYSTGNNLGHHGDHSQQEHPLGTLLSLLIMVGKVMLMLPARGGVKL